MQTVTDSYLMGIQEGRQFLRDHGPFSQADMSRIFDNLNALCLSHDADSETGQMFRGERDFWRDQIKRG